MNPRIAELAELIGAATPADGIHATSVPGVLAVRASCPSPERLHAVQKPAVCIIAQGAKRVWLHGEVHDYDASRFLVASVDLPVSAQVTLASPSTPYLCFQAEFDPAAIAAMRLKVPAATRRPRRLRGMTVRPVTDELLDAAIRLMRATRTPDDARLLAPLVREELLYRLVTDADGIGLVDVVRPNAHGERIARAIGWLKANFAETMRVDDLAAQVHMSPSSLHHHFRAMTAMSPLQYQKQLRLQEARRLLMTGDVDAATAGHRVGYESPSQFGRDYLRHFGETPARDARRLRDLSARTDDPRPAVRA